MIFSMPFHSEHAKALLEEAKTFNARLDQIDGDGGLRDLPVDVHLRTVIAAIHAGIEGQRWDSVAEGYLMLLEAEMKVRQAACFLSATRAMTQKGNGKT